MARWGGRTLTEIASAGHSNLAEMHNYSGRFQEALSNALRAKSLATALVERDATVELWQLRWAKGVLLETRLTSAAQGPLAAMRSLQGLVERLENLPRADAANSERTQLIASALLLVADLASSIDRPDAAISARKRVVELLSPTSIRVGPRLDATFAIALLSMGSADQAQAITDHLLEIEYREPSFIEALETFSKDRDISLSPARHSTRSHEQFARNRLQAQSTKWRNRQ